MIDVTQRLTLMMTRYLTATPSAHVPQCLCCKESLLLIPSAAASLLIRTLSAISANHWLLKSICPSVTPVSPGPDGGQAQVPGRPTLLQFEKSVRIFFPETSECSEDGCVTLHPVLEFI